MLLTAPTNLYEAGQNAARVLARLVVDLRGQLDDLPRDVTPQVAASLQHQRPRLHQEVVELLCGHSAAKMLPRQTRSFQSLTPTPKLPVGLNVNNKRREECERGRR